MTAVHEPDPAKRYILASDQPSQFLCEFLRFGLYGAEAGQYATEVYQNYFLELPKSERWSILELYKAISTDIGPPTPIAFSIFWANDPDVSIASTATIDFLSMGSEGDAGLVWWAQNVLDMIKDGKVQNPAAVIGGILALGDDRIPELLAPYRRNLNDDDAEVISKTASGSTHVSEIDFLLAWMEETVFGEYESDENTYGRAAAGLLRRVFGRTQPYILTGLRPYPYAPEKDERHRPENRLEPEEVGQLFADRLSELELLERAPRVLPFVMQALHVTPLTDQDTWAKFTIEELYSKFQ